MAATTSNSKWNNLQAVARASGGRCTLLAKLSTEQAMKPPRNDHDNGGADGWMAARLATSHLCLFSLSPFPFPFSPTTALWSGKLSFQMQDTSGVVILKAVTGIVWHYSEATNPQVPCILVDTSQTIKLQWAEGGRRNIMFKNQRWCLAVLVTLATGYTIAIPGGKLPILLLLPGNSLSSLPFLYLTASQADILKLGSELGRHGKQYF